MINRIAILSGIIFSIITTSALAQTITVPMYRVAPRDHQSIGNVTFTDTKFGLLVQPNLKGITTGIHGFHIHVNPSCKHVGQAAGSHYDPNKTGKHLGPYNTEGHLGDLPAITADRMGKITVPVLAPRLTVAKLKGRALMLHVGGDNYSDYPQKLGGGGGRFACGIIK